MQHTCLPAVVHPGQAEYGSRRTEVPDLLLAQLDVDRAALRRRAIDQRETVLAQPRRLGGQRRPGRRQGQPYVGPVLARALPDHRVGLQRQRVPVEHGPVGGPPQRARAEVAQAQPDGPGGRRFHGQLDMADQLGGFRLGQVHGLPGLPELDREGGQPGVHGAQLFPVRIPLAVHPVHLAGPAGSVALTTAGALTDLPQQIGRQPAEHAEAGVQPLALPPQRELFLFEVVDAQAKDGVLLGGRQRSARLPGAHDAHVEHGGGSVGGQLGVQGAVDGQRADRTEAQPLDPGRQVQDDAALDVGAVLQAGDGGDGKGDRLRGRGHDGCQLLRLPPTRALPAGMRIS